MNGEDIFYPDQIQAAFVDHFSNIYTIVPTCSSVNIHIAQNGSILWLEQGKLLDLTISNEKIKNALWSIPDEKALCLDGFNSMFYKASWSVVGDDVIKAVNQFFQNGKMLKSWNTTTITLNTKIQCPSHPREYRPILIAMFCISAFQNLFVLCLSWCLVTLLIRLKVRL